MADDKPGDPGGSTRSPTRVDIAKVSFGRIPVDVEWTTEQTPQDSATAEAVVDGSKKEVSAFEKMARTLDTISKVQTAAFEASKTEKKTEADLEKKIVELIDEIKKIVKSGNEDIVDEVQNLEKVVQTDQNSEREKDTRTAGEVPVALSIDALAAAPAPEPAAHPDQQAAVSLETHGGGSGKPGSSLFEMQQLGRADQLTKALKTLESVSEQVAEQQESLDIAIKNSALNIILMSSLERMFSAMTYRLVDWLNKIENFIGSVGSGEWGRAKLEEYVVLAAESSRRNMAGLVDILDNIIAMGPSFKSTMDAVQQNLDAGGRAYMSAGLDVMEYGMALRAQRDAINSRIDADANLDVGEQNELIQGVYDQLVRQGFRGAIDSERVTSYATAQLSVLREISRASGLSLKELMKSNETNVTANEAAARGFLSEKQTIAFQSITTLMEKGGLKDVSELLNKVVMNDGNIGLAFKDSPETLAVFGDFLSGVMGDIQSGRVDRIDEYVAALGDKLDRMDLRAGVAGEVLKLAGDIRSRLNEFQQSTRTADRGTPDLIVEQTLRRIARFFEDNEYLKGFGIFASLGMGVLNWGRAIFGGDAMAQHTAAMEAHSLAMLATTGGLFKFAGSLWGIIAAAPRLLGVGAIATVAVNATGGLVMDDEEKKKFGDSNKGWWEQFFEDAGGIITTGIVALVTGFSFWPAALAAAIYTGIDWLTRGALSNLAAKIGGWLYDMISSAWDWATGWFTGSDSDTSSKYYEESHFRTTELVEKAAAVATANAENQAAQSAASTHERTMVEILKDVNDALAVVAANTRQRGTFNTT